MKNTQLHLEGISQDEITEEFLVGIMDAAEDAELPIEGVSVIRREE